MNIPIPFDSLPFVVCLCPTYGRPPHLILNTIKMFTSQTYPRDRRGLLIYDDLGNLSIDPAAAAEYGVTLISSRERCSSLPGKYNQMLEAARTFSPLEQELAIVLWEDDDIYLPGHIEAHVSALQSHHWSHPQHVWRTCRGLHQEASAGIYHASLAFRFSFLRQIQGWDESQAPNFDQQLIAKATRIATPGRPLYGGQPTYVYRWSDTGATHGESAMVHGERWYSEYRPQHTAQFAIRPDEASLDPSAAEVFVALRQSQQ